MATSALYPSIEQVFNLARVYLNDAFAGATGTLGEGRIFTDTWTPNLTILNDAIDTYQLDLEDANVLSLRKETIITNIPVIWSAYGQGTPDPAALQNISFAGFFDGTNQTTTPALPTDLVLPLEISQRTTGTDLTFAPMSESPGMIESQYQDFNLGTWEWRTDAIYWNGALTNKDIRLRYQATYAIPLSVAPSAFPTTYITLMDCLRPLAAQVAYIFSASRNLPGGANGLLAEYNMALARVIQRYTRQKQSIVYERSPYGQDGDLFGFFG